MDPYRLQRQNSAIQKVLSQLLTSEVKDPRVGFVTIGGVELNRDQTVAKVFFSVIGDRHDRTKTFQGLKKARGYLQGRLSDILRLRATPDLRFVYDDSFERGLNVDEALSDLQDKGEFKDEATRNRERDMDSFMPPLDLMTALREAQDVWVIPHSNPDPDAMGGALALGQALDAAGADATVLRYPDIPHGFSVLPGIDKTPDPGDVRELFTEHRPDTVVLVDCHGLDRIGDYQELLADFENVWCIDHHLTGSKAPADGWIEPVASAASILVMRVIEELAAEKWEMNLDMATNLYAGIVADTGSFRYSNTYPFTFEAAHQLASLGVDTAGLGEKVLHQRTRAGMELLQRVIETFKFHADARILSLYVTSAMIRETGSTLADTEGIISLAAGVTGLQFVVFIKELGEGQWRVSLRSLGDGDVQQLAGQYGGGGHRVAAGCTLQGDVEELIDDLVGELSDQL
jgi:bifunctional oligoribonuclease and PAP phosphatase NrnA